jgi:DNA repair exonuclease SbcCD ATPase subunit
MRSDVTVLQRESERVTKNVLPAIEHSLDTTKETVASLSLSLSSQSAALERERDERTKDITSLKESVRESTTALAETQSKQFDSLSSSVTALQGQAQQSSATLARVVEDVREHGHTLSDTQRQLLDARETAKEVAAMKTLLETLSQRLTAVERENQELKVLRESERRVTEKEIERLTDALAEQRNEVSLLRSENVELKTKYVDRESFQAVQKELRETQATILTQATSLFKILTEQYQFQAQAQAQATMGQR